MLGGLVLIATVGLGLLTSLLLSRTLARPLTEMSQAAGKIAAGNLDHPLTLDSPDELGDLARSLNRMASDLRAHEEALRAERTDLAAKNAELERFNYTVSHDLKTPLVTIRGFAGLAATDLADGRNEAVRKDLGRIVAAADKMHHLLDDLLELSRIGRVVHPPLDVDLADLVKDAIELLKGPLEAKRIEPQVAADLPTVRADRRRLLEVLQNLIENATKFTGSQAQPKIEVGWCRDGEAVFFVRDNGQASSRAFSSACSGSSRSSTRAATGPEWAWRSCGASSKPTAGAPGPSPRASATARPSALRSPAGARGALEPPEGPGPRNPG